MTALAAIADQSDAPLWGWRGWAVMLLVAFGTWAVITRREHVRRQSRKRDGRA